NVARIANFFVNAQSCVPAGTPTASVTPTTTSASATPTSTPTSTPNVTPTTTCVGTTYSDNFSVNSLGNYSVYDGDWNPSTATAQSIQIVSGEFQVAPTSGVVYPYTIVNDSSFSQSLGDYRVEGDFKLDTVGPGVFGVIVRATAASAYGYIFQWNGLNNRWEIEKQIAPGNYYYPATNASSAYTQGTWVHLKLVAGPGNLFNAYITPSGGAQQQIFSGVTDPGTTTPYATGGAGIRAYNVVGGNILHVQNFIASTCP
ncbi:MAG TPA: hypothetical protein VK859_05795, partial [bacterium]|nr:hypothetical protein [bacterium]